LATKQAIAGVAPPTAEERTVMVVWPSIAAYPSGRWLGRLYSNSAGFYIFTVGNLLALLSIPHALALYFYRLLPSFFGLPWYGTRYVLTNRRIVELRNEFRFADNFPFVRFYYGVEEKSVELDRFTAIEVVRRPGQDWFRAGDLVFSQDGVETFRLVGVSRPETFRQTCMKSRNSFVGVKRALEAVPA
jgi:hypothetical protein